MTSFEALARVIIETGGRVSGLTADEIREITLGQGLDRLPARYEEYLRFLGGPKSFSLIAGIESYPYLVELKDEARALLETEGHPELLPDTAVVIGIHGGYAVHWLTDAALDDPPVQLYEEGDAGVAAEWPSFTACVEEHARVAGLPWGSSPG
uniref:hypothetical protein n=1 Tax=Paractinoplanes polyasparticus TaxID=2856853 RepID=UPI001C843827|nr:hypothetical protein [Actinoplanes polyasparticus]